MMNLIFQKEREAVQNDLMRLSGDVEKRLVVVLKAIGNRDAPTLQEWMKRDNEIDAKEVRIEEECLKILALHQPVACDLRFLIAVLKINNDLERIGDIVVNIAERGVQLLAYPAFDILEQVLTMGDMVKSMLGDCLDALVEFNSDKARDVIARDEIIDQRNRDVVESVVELVRADNTGAAVKALIQIYTIARYIERMGDHITNIAEDVAYLVDGTIIRHQQQN
jgi:phosphate transport system protein